MNPVTATIEVVFRLYRGADCDPREPHPDADGHVADLQVADAGHRRFGRAVQSAAAGTYRWRAFYSAATPTTTPCAGPATRRTRTPSSRPTAPTIATVATPNFVLGAGQLADNATVSGLVNPIAAQDEVVFRLYRGADCADANLILTRTEPR